MARLPENNPKDENTLRKEAEKLYKQGREIEAIRMMDEQVGDRTRAWELRKDLFNKNQPNSKSKLRATLTEIFVTPGRPTKDDKRIIRSIISQQGDTILFDLVLSNRRAVEEAKRALKSGEINGRNISHMTKRDKISHIIGELRTRYPINDDVYKYLKDSDTLLPPPDSFKKRAGKNLKIQPELAKSRVMPGYNVKINNRYYHALSENVVLDLQNGRPMRLNDVLDRIPIPEEGYIDIRKTVVPETDDKNYTSKDKYKVRTLERRHNAILDDKLRNEHFTNLFKTKDRSKSKAKITSDFKRAVILDTESMVVEQTSRSNLLSVGYKTMDFRYDPKAGKVVESSKLGTFIPIENFELDTISSQQIEKAQIKVKDEIRYSNETMHKYLKSMLEKEDVSDVLRGLLQKRQGLDELIARNAPASEIAEEMTKVSEAYRTAKRTIQFTHEGLSTGLKGTHAAPVEVTFGSMDVPSSTLAKSDYAAIIQDFVDTSTHGIYAFNSQFDMGQLDEIKVRLPKEGIKDIRGLSIMKMRELFSDIGPLNSDAMFKLFQKPAERASDILGLSNMDRIEFMKSFRQDIGTFTAGMDVETLYRFMADDPKFFERHIEYLDPEVEAALADHTAKGRIRFGDVKSLKSYKETLPVFDDEGYLSIEKLKNLNRKKLSPKARKMKKRLYSDLASRWVKMRSLKWMQQNDYELRRTSKLLEGLIVEETGKTENAVKINREELRDRNVRKYAENLIEKKRGLTRGSYYEIMSGILDEHYTTLSKGHRINEAQIEKNVAFFAEQNFKGGFSDKLKGRMLTERPLGGAFKAIGAMALLSVGVSALTRLTTTFGEGDQTLGKDPDRTIEGLRHDSMYTIVNRLFHTDFGSGKAFWNRTFNVFKESMESLVSATGLRRTYISGLTGLNRWITKSKPITPFGQMIKTDSQKYIHNLTESARKIQPKRLFGDIDKEAFNKMNNMTNTIREGFESMTDIAKKHKTAFALGVGGVVLTTVASSYDPPEPDPNMGRDRSMSTGMWENFKSRFTLASESRHRHTDFGSGMFNKAVRAGRYALKYMDQGAYTWIDDAVKMLETFGGYQYHKVPKEIADYYKDRIILGAPTSSYGKRTFIGADRTFTSLARKTDDAAALRTAKHRPASDVVRYNSDTIRNAEQIVIDKSRTQTPFMYSPRYERDFMRVNSAKSTIERVATRPQHVVDVIEEPVSPGWQRLVGEVTDNSHIMSEISNRRVVKGTQNVYKGRTHSTVTIGKRQRMPTLPRANVMNATKEQPAYRHFTLKSKQRDLYTPIPDEMVNNFVTAPGNGKGIKFKGTTAGDALDDQIKAFAYQYRDSITKRNAYPYIDPTNINKVNSNIYAADQVFTNRLMADESHFTRRVLNI